MKTSDLRNRWAYAHSDRQLSLQESRDLSDQASHFHLLRFFRSKAYRSEQVMLLASTHGPLREGVSKSESDKACTAFRQHWSLRQAVVVRCPGSSGILRYGHDRPVSRACVETRRNV